MTLLRPLRTLTWKRWAWATAIPLFIAITLPLQNFHQNWYWAQGRIISSAPLYLFFSYTMLVSIAFAESNATDDTGPPAWRYVAALLAATALYAAALGAFPGLLTSPPREVRAGQTVNHEAVFRSEAPAAAQRINAMLNAANMFAYGWIGMLVYVRLRNSRRAARALADAEIERSRAQRNLLASQLLAAHAQVDPEFVLRELGKVERAYEIDVARGDLMLDEFIVYLRDAIPRLRDETAAAAP